MAKNRRRDLYERTSRTERSIARWHFRRYNDLCQSIKIHEEMGQGINQERGVMTHYKTPEDSADYVINLRLRNCMEYVRDQYIDESVRDMVWSVAVDGTAIAALEPYYQGVVKAQMKILYEGFCKEWGLDTTRNVRLWGTNETKYYH